ncbi:hypothetical protein FRC02_011195 [Tulasnella sp. 418]|nr:hypothetical protein FRC02_011195 [Tulasnella sp. 418]
MKFSTLSSIVFAALPLASAHYTWTSLIVGSTVTPAWQYVRTHTNMNSPVTAVNSIDFRCNKGASNGASTQTAAVTAGSTIGFSLDNTLYHSGVLNVYMAKAPSTASTFDGSGSVWFKVYQISAIADGKSIKFPADGLNKVTFTVPKNLPNGEYLVRVEHIALHVAQSFGGAQFYISCGQIKVSGGGSGNPGPKVAIPGVYTGNEPGILINIYNNFPTQYIQPGPAVWSG